MGIRTGCVCNLHTQNEDEGSVIRTRQVVADQTTHLLILGHKAQPKRPCDIRDQEYQDEDAASVLEAIVEVDASEDRQSD